MQFYAHFYSVILLTDSTRSAIIRAYSIILIQEENKMKTTNAVPKYMTTAITVIQCVTAAAVLGLFALLCV